MGHPGSRTALPGAGALRRALLVGVLATVPAAILPSGLRGQDPPPDSAGDRSVARGRGSATDVVLDVPFLPQSELLCGGAAATMVLRYWGATGVFPEDFRPLVRPDEGGIRTDELTEELELRGWRARPFQGTDAGLRRHMARGHPVIALIEVAPERYHYVVVVAWTDEAVVFHDPAEAPFQAVSPAEFRAAWLPTDRWSLLVLPSSDDPDSLPESERRDTVAELATPSSEERRFPEDAAGRADSSACALAVERAVARARAGDRDEAESILRVALERCPDSARLRGELAGIQSGRGEWERAAELARRAVELDPSYAHAWRILATSRFLLGDRVGALAAWNRVEEPRIERIRLQGLDGTRYAEVQGRVGLSPDTLLTPERLRLASRRLSLLPSALETGVRYRPREDGRAEVIGTVVQRPVLPSSVPAWGGILAKGALSRSVTVPLASPFGAGELWTLEGRWEEHRPALVLDVALPGVPLLPGVVSLRGGWERQSYLTDPTPIADLLVEDRRMARLRATDWWTGRLRWELRAGLDRWMGDPGPAAPTPGDGSLDAVFGAGVELRTLSDELSLRVRGGGGTLLSGSPKRTYLDGGIRLRWRSSTERDGFVAHLRAGGRAVTEDAPLAYWPGAGDGRARDGLLRSHALLDAGRIIGEAFGRRLLDGGAEGRWWLSWVPGIPIAVAGFVDAARPWDTLGSLQGAEPAQKGFLLGAGMGLRVAVPGRSGTGRADLATDLRDGGWRLHVGWEAEWPGL